ncbi:MAG TPA: SH3 domain-containing protein [Leptolyngbyaceae cyanobacterium]
MKRSLFFHLLLGSIVGCQNPHLVSTDSIVQQPTPVANNNQTESNAEKQLSSSLRNCQISAYVINKDPKGLNVRSAPNPNASVVKKLPANNVAIVVDVVASQNYWVQISNAVGDNGNIFKGKGWLYTPLLGTSTRGYGTKGVSLHSSPNNNSSVLGTIPPETGVKLISCSGEWAYVSHNQLQGWLAKTEQCPNPLTTCP